MAEKREFDKRERRPRKRPAQLLRVTPSWTTKM